MTVVVGRSATRIADLVRDGVVTAVEVTRAHLDQLAMVEDRLGAFVTVRQQAALEEAAALDANEDLARLPLAGVPIAVTDVLDLAGEPTRHGSAATVGAPAHEDHAVVARCRAAGAVVLGRTRSPELGLWGTSDDADGISVSPWDPTRTAGGSSGGGAAAVSAGVVPLAVGPDGLGSVRIPAACCGTVGLKPGGDLARMELDGEPQWFGMSRCGAMGTTVADVALGVDVLSGTAALRDPQPVQRKLSVAVSWKAPAPGVVVAGAWREAAIEAGRLLHHAGHEVVHEDPPYERATVQAAIARWTVGPGREAEQRGLDIDGLQPRTRAHLAAGERFGRVTPVRDEDAVRWSERVAPFLERYDVLVTPAFARSQPAAAPWHERPWAANVASNLSTYPFCAPWNLADLPALTLPLWHDGGRPLSVQLVAAQGHEALLLAVASQLGELVPWTRHAPGWGVPV